jgi:hypothetical protein
MLDWLLKPLEAFLNAAKQFVDDVVDCTVGLFKGRSNVQTEKASKTRTSLLQSMAPGRCFKCAFTGAVLIAGTLRGAQYIDHEEAAPPPPPYLVTMR